MSSSSPHRAPLRAGLSGVGRRLRGEAFRLLRLASPYVVVTRRGGHYLVATRDAGPGRKLFVSAGPEVAVLARALDVLASHSMVATRQVFLDVGAHIGTTALPALTEHGFGRVIAFEPDPEHARLLRATAALNGLHSRLEVVEAAVSAEPGRKLLARGATTASGWRSGLGRIVSTPRAGGETIEVAAVVLDDALRERDLDPAEVGLLWMDVQGHEGHVLRGAASLMTCSRPIVFAARRRKLEATGCYEELLDCVARCYAWIVDLRPTDWRHGWEPTIRPAVDLAGVIQNRRTTDVLAFGELPAIGGR